jgi:hypothetical protein
VGVGADVSTAGEVVASGGLVATGALVVGAVVALPQADKKSEKIVINEKIKISFLDIGAPF